MSSYYIYKPERKRDYELLAEDTRMTFTDLWDLVEVLLRHEKLLDKHHTIQKVER